MQTVGLSPKVIAAAIVGVIVYAVTKLGIQLDPVLEQAINVAAVIIAAYLAPPGAVTPVAVDAPPVSATKPTHEEP